jgi:hypothetical protein
MPRCNYGSIESLSVKFCGLSPYFAKLTPMLAVRVSYSVVYSVSI